MNGEEKLMQMLNLSTGEIRIVAPVTCPCWYYLPPYLEQFGEKYPKDRKTHRVQCHHAGDAGEFTGGEDRLSAW